MTSKKRLRERLGYLHVTWNVTWYNGMRENLSEELSVMECGSHLDCIIFCGFCFSYYKCFDDNGRVF